MPLTDTLSKSDVINCLDDWKERLNALFSKIKDWLPSGYSMKADKMKQPVEELMRKFDIQPDEIPFIQVKTNREKIIIFKPSGLWYIGAKGRIDIITEKDHFLLVDLDGFEGKTGWHLLPKTLNKKQSPFNREIFLKLIG